MVNTKIKIRKENGSEIVRIPIMDWVEPKPVMIEVKQLAKVKDPKGNYNVELVVGIPDHRYTGGSVGVCRLWWGDFTVR